jgi:transcriptional regulator with XRE-family HTH domain
VNRDKPLAAFYGAEPLAAVVGANCRRIRGTAGITQDELASHARDVGLRWTASKVGRFERGEYSPTLATVLAVSAALSEAIGSGVDLSDLVRSDGWVGVTDVFAVEWGALQHMVCRQHRAVAFVPTGASIGTPLPQRPSLDAERLAQRLGVSDDDLEKASLQLWGRSFSDERDKRAGPGANPQQRGHVSRVLQAELEKTL